jgi:aldehyde:ferredoxin oxidoreductase
MITMAYGHAEKILRVDLSSGRIETEPLPDPQVLRKWVGGTGLGLYYLAKECPPETRATDPEAPSIIMTGPLAGTRAPSSSNHVFISPNFDIPYAAGAGFSHGFWAAFLKFAGYEGVIITGRSDRPVYLLIDDANVELRDAAPYWGLGTRETERRIKRDLDIDADEMSVACIGQAGEAMLPGAMVKNDRNHGAGKGSPGAVWGAQHLKAIAVRGTGAVSTAAPDAFLQTVVQWEENLFQPIEEGVLPLAALWHNGGMTRNHRAMSERGITAGKNLTDQAWSKGFSERYMEACARWRVDPQPSYNCSIACAYDVRITDGPFAGSRVSLCGGGEPFEGAAGLIGVDDAGAALMMTEHYDDIGWESGLGGAVLGMAFEAFDRGILSLEDTDGLDLSWGNYESALDVIQQMIERRGFGERLASTMKDAAAAVSSDAEQFLVHVKGAGINMHDWRPIWGTLLAQIIAGTGPSHQIAYNRLRWWDPDVSPDDQMDAIPAAQAEKIWQDCTGVCMFASQGVKDIDTLAPQAVAQATGWSDFTPDEALAVGERVVNMMRLIALSRGFTKRDELDVSPRLLEAPDAGPGAGRAFGPHLAERVDAYYRAMGWDTESGRPTKETLERLDLLDVADQLGVTV